MLLCIKFAALPAVRPLDTVQYNIELETNGTTPSPSPAKLERTVKVHPC